MSTQQQHLTTINDKDEFVTFQNGGGKQQIEGDGGLEGAMEEYERYMKEQMMGSSELHGSKESSHYGSITIANENPNYLSGSSQSIYSNSMNPIECQIVDDVYPPNYQNS